jgi:hypothetical protein
VVTLDTGESDFPWFVGWLDASPHYAAVERLFAEMSRIHEGDGFTDESGELNEQIMGPGIGMRTLPDGKWSEVVGISIEGRRVSWRI